MTVFNKSYTSYENKVARLMLVLGTCKITVIIANYDEAYSK